MSFVQRLLNFKITLGPQQAGTNTPLSLSPNVSLAPTGSTLSISNQRASVRVQSAGATVGSSASVKIYGLPQNIMNQLATLGMVWNIVPKNQIAIMAGDASILASQFSTIFTGTIFAAYADYNNASDVPFCIDAKAGLDYANIPASPSSYPQSATVAQIMQDIATRMGVNFENNGVTSGFNGPSYFKGTLYQQFQHCRDAALPPISAELVDGETTLAIWPRVGNRITSIVPTISPQTGMIAYPSYTMQGIMVKTVFNPEIKLGRLITVNTSLPLLSGGWSVTQLNHALDSIVPNGQWMTTISAWDPNAKQPTQAVT